MRTQSNAIAIAVTALVLVGASPAMAQDNPSGRTGPPVVFSAPLPDVPGVNLTVVELSFPPNPRPPSTTENHGPGHRHPGSVFVYVTQGAVRLGLDGEPVQVVHTGESCFEPPMALHVIAESASATEPARAIAVMLVPEGQPLTIPNRE